MYMCVCGGLKKTENVIGKAERAKIEDGKPGEGEIGEEETV